MQQLSRERVILYKPSKSLYSRVLATAFVRVYIYAYCASVASMLYLYAIVHQPIGLYVNLCCCHWYKTCSTSLHKCVLSLSTNYSDIGQSLRSPVESMRQALLPLRYLLPLVPNDVLYLTQQ